MKKQCALFGGILMDKYIEIDSLPPRGQDGFITGVMDSVGGCALNMAATFMNLGGEPHIVSSLGMDSIGKEIAEYISNHGFSTRYIKHKIGETGYCLVFLETDGERTFLTKKGMNTDFFPDLVSDELSGIDYAALTGYYLLPEGTKEIVELLENFVARGGLLLFDPSPLVSDIDKNLLKRILSISKVITPNMSEILAMEEVVSKLAEESVKFEEAMGTGAGREVKACKLLAALDKFVVLKDGSRGGQVFGREGSFSYEVAKGPSGISKASVVDTSGAGDSFAAGLMYDLMDTGKEELNLDSFRTAVALASKCAAITVGVKGPHGFWSLSEL